MVVSVIIPILLKFRNLYILYYVVHLDFGRAGVWTPVFGSRVCALSHNTNAVLINVLIKKIIPRKDSHPTINKIKMANKNKLLKIAYNMYLNINEW